MEIILVFRTEIVAMPISVPHPSITEDCKGKPIYYTDFAYAPFQLLDVVGAALLITFGLELPRVISNSKKSQQG